jgi:hypothetical protein
MLFKPNTPETFWSRIDKNGPNGCWLWTGSKTRGGYGALRYQKKRYRAARLAWELTHGPIPDGLCVLHNCPGGDNPACANPAHLWLGTNAENSADMVRKGRAATGGRNGSRTHPERMAVGSRHWTNLYPDRAHRHERHPMAKLTWIKVRAIRLRYAQGGITQASLAKEYGVSQRNIHSIIRGETWVEP